MGREIAGCPRFASVLCELTWAKKYPGADASFRRLPVASRPLRFNFHHCNFPQGVMPKTAPFPPQVSSHRTLANLGHRALAVNVRSVAKFQSCLSQHFLFRNFSARSLYWAGDQEMVTCRGATGVAHPSE